VKPLVPPDAYYQKAAQGWLELGNYLEANAELDQITPELCVHPDVLEICWEIYAKYKHWGACVQIDHVIINGDPYRPTTLLHSMPASAPGKFIPTWQPLPT
jgi:hypothetical protein